MEATQKLVRFISETKATDIPQAALLQAKAGILDWLFVALAGQAQANEALSNYCEQVTAKGGVGESSLIGARTKTAENRAALINGCIGHVLDYDETCPKVRSHLFAAILPALLAAGEARAISGSKLLTSFIVGHEVAMRVGEAITPEWIKAGWHGTSVFGIFGAVAGCAKLFDLDGEKIRHAIGLASSMACGVAVNFGSLAKPLHAGMAAERGLFAAQLASSGFSANPNALEGPLGFFHAYNQGQPARTESFGHLGSPWGLETKGISAIKLYPCCHGLATNIECGIRIHQKHHLKLEEIQSVEIHSQPKTLCAMLSKQYDTGEALQWGYQGPPRQIKTILPTTGAQAKFSKEYAFSRALKDGELRMRHLTDEAVNEPVMRKWMDKVKLFHNSELEEYSNQYPEENGPHAEKMIVRLKDGRIIEEQEIFILGMAKRPLGEKDVAFKYDDCGLAAGLNEEKIESIISAVGRLENVKDMTEFMVEVAC